MNILYELTIGCVLSTFRAFYGKQEKVEYIELTRADRPSDEWKPVKMGSVTVYRKEVEASEWQEYRRVHGL